jgi:hypothetical protein
VQYNSFELSIFIKLNYPVSYIEAKFEPAWKRIKKQLTSIEMKFFRRKAWCTLFSHKRNEDILEELVEEPVEEKLRR